MRYFMYIYELEKCSGLKKERFCVRSTVPFPKLSWGDAVQTGGPVEGV